MKKVLIVTLATGAMALSAMAQGTVTFAASSSHGLVSYSTDDANKTSVPTATTAQVGTYGELNIALYTAPQGQAVPFGATVSTIGSLPAAWLESVNLEHQVAPTAGSTPNIVFSINTAETPGTTYQATILAWTGTYTDWNSAWTAYEGGAKVLFGWTGSTLSSGIGDWAQATGNVAMTVPSQNVIYGATTGFAGLSLEYIAPVPEPSTFALAGLGAAALMIFRRRK